LSSPQLSVITYKCTKCLRIKCRKRASCHYKTIYFRLGHDHIPISYCTLFVKDHLEVKKRGEVVLGLGLIFYQHILNMSARSEKNTMKQRRNETRFWEIDPFHYQQCFWTILYFSTNDFTFMHLFQLFLYSHILGEFCGISNLRVFFRSCTHIQNMLVKNQAQAKDYLPPFFYF
jgi:hypothetical protein